MNVSHLVHSAAEHHPAALAFVDPDGARWTWAEIERGVATLAVEVRQAGAGPGDTAAVLMPNAATSAIALWGVQRAGVAAVPLNPAYTPHELAYMLADAGPRVLLAPPPLLALARAALDRAASAATVLAVDAPELRSEGAPRTAAPDAGGGVAVICYTSGTTGRPKGARLTHANLLANLDAISALPQLTLQPGEVFLGVLPFFHVFGLNVVCNAAARHAAAVVALDRFTPAGALAAMAAEGVTIAYGAPPVFAALVAAADAAPPLPALRAAVSGADALPVPLFERFAECYGLPILEGYGLTETAPVVASSAAAAVVRPGTVGVPVPGVDIRLVAADWSDVPAGEAGEIAVRGPNVFEGYLGAPEATAEVLREGWLRTGDLGRLDGHGHLSIAGRLKDLIIVSGFNVYPREVEDALRAHPAVAEVAVVGVPDPRTGELVRAVVVLRPGAVASHEQLVGHCRERLARYKLPREISIVDALPRSATGKVARQALKQRER